MPKITVNQPRHLCTPRINAENQLQATCFQHAWNHFPDTRRLLCYNLGNSKNKVDGARNKAMGLIKGRADLELLWRGTIHYFELKFGDGRQSPDQKTFQNTVEQHGAKYYIVDSFDQFVRLLTHITKD